MLPSLSRSGFLCLRASSSRVTLGSALSPRFLRPQARPHQLRFPLRTSSTSTKPDFALNDKPVTSAIAHDLADPKRPEAPETLFDRVLPKWAMGAKPYLLLTRIDKPNGAILLFWPGGIRLLDRPPGPNDRQGFPTLRQPLTYLAWAITMAASVNHLPPTVPAFYLGLFAVGALVMRGAGCTVNDMWDAKFDRQVERTKWRPIAAGDVSQLGALTFLGAQLSVGLAILTQLNWYSIVLGASSVGFVIMYPFMKRITYYPQIFFALTFHWGCMLGWSAVAGSVNWPIVLPMYIGSIAWGVMYDCIYAHQDKLDDIKAGVKSIALRFPDSRPLISGLSAFFVSGLTLTGHLAGLGPLYYVISCLGSALHLGWQCKTVDFDNRQDCWRKFCSNGLLGGLIWLGIAADYIYEVVIPGDYE